MIGVQFGLASPGRTTAGPGILGAVVAVARRVRARPIRIVWLRSTVERDRAEMLGLIRSRH